MIDDEDDDSSGESMSSCNLMVSACILNMK